MRRRLCVSAPGCIVLAFAAACVGSDPNATSTPPADGGGSDAGSSDSGVVTTDGGSDAAEAGPPCDLTKPWTAPVQLAGVNLATADDVTARLTPDEKTVYFASTRGNGTDAQPYYSTRPTANDGFGAAKPVPVDVDGGTVVGTSPTARPDDLALVFETPPRAIGDIQRSLNIMLRASTMASFGAPTTIANISGPGRGEPFLTIDGTRLFYVIDATHHIFTAKANGDGFDPATEVNGLATPANKRDGFPVASNDGLTLFFTSDRDDAQSKGGLEIWMATRKSLADDFSSPVLVPSLNSDGDDWPSWLSLDQCTIYLTSNRAVSGDTPHFKIFRATRQQ